MDRTFETSHLSAVRAVPRTVFRFIFVKFFASGLKKRHVLVSMETLWLMATEKATREALLSEAGFENVFPTQNWVVGASCFVCCLNPVEVSFLLFRFVWWLDCLLLKEGPSAFCRLLEVFLVGAEFAGFVQVAGFHLDDCRRKFRSQTSDNMDR